MARTPTDELFQALHEASAVGVATALSNGACLATGLYSASPAPVTCLLNLTCARHRDLWEVVFDHLDRKPEALARLLEWGGRGETVLHRLTSYPATPHSARHLRRFMALGFSIEARDFMDNTPLAACHPSWVKTLIKAGADLYARAHRGRSPLYHSLRATVEGYDQAALRVVALRAAGWQLSQDPGARPLMTFLRQHARAPYSETQDQVYQVFRAEVLRGKLEGKVSGSRRNVVSRKIRM